MHADMTWRDRHECDSLLRPWHTLTNSHQSLSAVVVDAVLTHDELLKQRHELHVLLADHVLDVDFVRVAHRSLVHAHEGVLAQLLLELLLERLDALENAVSLVHALQAQRLAAVEEKVLLGALLLVLVAVVLLGLLAVAVLVALQVALALEDQSFLHGRVHVFDHSAAAAAGDAGLLVLLGQ